MCKLHFCTKTGTLVNRNYLEKAESFKEKRHTVDSDRGALQGPRLCLGYG